MLIKPDCAEARVCTVPVGAINGYTLPNYDYAVQAGTGTLNMNHALERTLGMTMSTQQ